MIYWPYLELPKFYCITRKAIFIVVNHVETKTIKKTRLKANAN